MFNQPPTMPPVMSAPAPSVAPSGSAKLAKQGNNSLIKTVIIILLTLLLIGGLLLAYYFYNEYKLASTDVDSKVSAAVVAREKEITDKLEAEFAEREKIPYKTFTGPDDYGTLSFKYPKTWSVYVSKDASKGGDFEAYLHPVEVPPVSNETSLALRVIIRSESFEAADNRYKGLVSSGKLSTSVISVNGTDANRYDGTLPNNLVGSIVIVKIRDKVVTLETDAEIYREDFNNIIETITFNQ
ncbi:hypothetical protein IKF74_00770 [Candidatus Saccharibacteria bacterium]|nr:hypothetical protein [Candidatus Saccharibacteria bacterium]